MPPARCLGERRAVVESFLRYDIHMGAPMPNTSQPTPPMQTHESIDGDKFKRDRVSLLMRAEPDEGPAGASSPEAAPKKAASPLRSPSGEASIGCCKLSVRVLLTARPHHGLAAGTRLRLRVLPSLSRRTASLQGSGQPLAATSPAAALRTPLFSLSRAA